MDDNRMLSLIIPLMEYRALPWTFQLPNMFLLLFLSGRNVNLNPVWYKRSSDFLGAKYNDQCLGCVVSYVWEFYLLLVYACTCFYIVFFFRLKISRLDIWIPRSNQVHLILTKLWTTGSSFNKKGWSGVLSFSLGSLITIRNMKLSNPNQR